MKMTTLEQMIESDAKRIIAQSAINFKKEWGNLSKEEIEHLVDYNKNPVRKGIFNSFKKIPKWLRNTAAGVLFALMSQGVFAGDGLFKRYVPMVHGGSMPVKTEVTLFTNPILGQGYSENYSTTYVEAYAPDGTLLETNNNIGLYFGSYKAFSVKDLFPDLDTNNIGWLEIGADNRVDAWIKYVGTGTAMAAVKAPSVLKSEVPIIHIIPKNNYWQSFVSGVAVSDEANQISAKFFPSGLEMIFDGTTNDYGYSKDLSQGPASINVEVKELFGGDTSVEGMDWLVFSSRYVDESNPFNTVDEPKKNMVAVAPFFKTNGTCGGAFETEQILSSRFYMPHYAHNSSADGKPFWWNGYVLVNPTPEDSEVLFVCRDSAGNNLGVYKNNIAAGGKLIGLLRDLDLPEGTDQIEVISEQPLYRGFLFGGEPGTSLEKIMAGVDLTPSGLVGGLVSVTDQDDIPEYRYFVPLADSRSPTENEDGAWTGLVIVNNGVEKEIKLSYVNQDNVEIGSQFLNLKHNEKFVGTLEDLLKEAGLESIREEVKGIYIDSNPRNMQNGNTPLQILGLVGGISKDDGSHVGMIGVSPVLVNNSAPEVYLSLENESMGLEETVANSTTLILEDKDKIKYNITVKLQNPYDRIDHVSIKVVDKDGNIVGRIGGGDYIDLPQDANFYNGYLLNLSGGKIVDSDVGPYSVDDSGNPLFNYHLAVDLTVNGQTYTYRFDPNPVSGELPKDTTQIAIVPEKDYNINDEKGDGWAREKIGEDPEGFVDILVRDGAIWGGTTPITEDNRQAFVNYYKRLTNGVISDGEVDNVIDRDQSVPKDYATYLVIYIKDDPNENSFSEPIYINSEKAEYELRKFFELTK